jgi:hypothetical protein
VIGRRVLSADEAARGSVSRRLGAREIGSVRKIDALQIGAREVDGREIGERV